MSKIDFESAKMILNTVPDDKMFIGRDGTVFRCLEDLPTGIKVLGQDMFNYHVTPSKNDFATWIYNVIGDVKLAEDIGPIKEMNPMIKKIKARITQLKKKISKGA